jgi:hypothetical protein
MASYDYTTPLPDDVQARRIRMNILREYLLDTDYKVLPDYDRPNGDVVAQRQLWRDELRALIAEDETQQ